MDLTYDLTVQQMAYRLYNMAAPRTVGEYIYECMDAAAAGAPDDIASAQAFFVKVTAMLSELDPEYSVACSAAYLLIVTENFGDLEILKNGDEHG